MRFRPFAFLLLSLTMFPVLAVSQTDEIQVYDGEIAPPGILNLMIHNNFTPKGRTVPTYPGAIVANHSYQVTAEWAYGVKPWLEQGLYLPVSSPYSTNHGSTITASRFASSSRAPTLTTTRSSTQRISSLVLTRAIGNLERSALRSGRS